MTEPTRPTSGTAETLTLILGTVIVLATMGAWLYAKTHDVDGVAELMGFVVPVVSALLIVRQVDKVHATTRQVERQTNGELTRRLEEHRRELLDVVRAELAGTPSTSTPVDPPSSSGMV